MNPPILFAMCVLYPSKHTRANVGCPGCRIRSLMRRFISHLAVADLMGEVHCRTSPEWFAEANVCKEGVMCPPQKFKAVGQSKKKVPLIVRWSLEVTNLIGDRTRTAVGGDRARTGERGRGIVFEFEGEITSSLCLSSSTRNTLAISDSTNVVRSGGVLGRLSSLDWKLTFLLGSVR